MKPLSKLPRSKLEKVKILLFDLDGTFVNDDKLQSSTYTSLEKVINKGIKTIVVTGRPAGWCDLMARWWPVDSVIGENGALSYCMIEGQIQRDFFDSSLSLEKSDELLNSLLEEIKFNFGEIVLAADQAFRQWDLALDISEENSMPMDKVKKIYDFCLRKGANAAISNIHLNIWYGNYTKLDMAMRILKKWRIDVEECIYIGDSPNDEEIFKEFPFSVGVKSVEKYSTIMHDYPKYITDKDANQGFEELVNFILLTK